MRSIPFRFSFRVRHFFPSFLLLTVVPLFATERSLTITAPSTAAPGSSITASISATTDGAEGEQIGFFHAEYSTDDGKSWTGFCYEQNAGKTMTRQVVLTAGEAGSKARLRARIAFRGGPAGDVDFNGAAIKWKNSWEAWESPPAKYATITVSAP